MSNLKLKTEDAIKAYKEATAEEKRFLEKLYPHFQFSRNPTDWIKNFDQVCEATGKNPNDYIITPGMDEEERHNIYARKMVLIYKVFNEGWKPDWSSKEYKYYPWFRGNGSSFSLRLVHYNYVGTHVSPRLCSHSSEIVKYICENFSNEYNQYLS